LPRAASIFTRHCCPTTEVRILYDDHGLYVGARLKRPDPNAIRTVMGHTDESIDATYTHGIADERLAAVAEHVRAWLYPPQPDAQQGNGTEGGAK